MQKLCVVAILILTICIMAPSIVCAESASEALIKASDTGDISEVKRMLAKKDINVNAKGYLRNAALHRAANKGHLEVVKLLLKAGAKPDLEGADQNPPLYFAAKKGYLKICIALLNGGADPNKVYQSHARGTLLTFGRLKLPVVRVLVKAGANVRATNSEKSTALHLAVRFGSPELVTFLLSKGADPNAKSGFREPRTPLHLAFTQKARLENVELILKAKADPNLPGKKGNRVLHDAAKMRDEGAIKLLLRYGADATTTNKYGETPLHAFARKSKGDEKDQRILDVLLKAGAKINAKSAKGNTPMDLVRWDDSTTLFKAAGGKAGKDL